MKDEVIGAPMKTVAYDQQELAQLVRVAMGDRSIKDMMAQTGLSRSVISKLLNAHATSQPEAKTLLKLAGGSPTPLFWKMIEVCGITREEQEQMRKLQQISAAFDISAKPMKTGWSKYTALSAVLRSLERRGYGRDFEIDFRGEGVFAVDIGEEYPLLLFIPVTADGQDSAQTLSAARDGLSYAFTQWDMSDIRCFLLTDSEPVYELLQQMVSETVQMAVVLATEDGTDFRAQHLIKPIISAYSEGEAFGFDLAGGDA